MSSLSVFQLFRHDESFLCRRQKAVLAVSGRCSFSPVANSAARFAVRNSRLDAQTSRRQVQESRAAKVDNSRRFRSLPTQAPSNTDNGYLPKIELIIIISCLRGAASNFFNWSSSTNPSSSELSTRPKSTWPPPNGTDDDDDDRLSPKKSSDDELMTPAESKCRPSRATVGLVASKSNRCSSPRDAAEPKSNEKGKYDVQEEPLWVVHSLGVCVCVSWGVWCEKFRLLV